tara:strand:- start:864 stop:1022 length:159 start_codon:yes stop_codon:yes gene_type:complete
MLKSISQQNNTQLWVNFTFCFWGTWLGGSLIFVYLKNKQSLIKTNIGKPHKL